MPDIDVKGLTKRYGAVSALDDLTAHVTAGRITAFLGANGSGKTTTMRVLLGLSEPDAGSAKIGGLRYRDLPHPLRVVGAALDQGFHPRRTARNHLRLTAMQAGVRRSRVEEVLDLVELGPAARRWVGGFSLGMRQRLSLAAALIGEPEVLVLDEPFNGLDPMGISVMRRFLRGFADQGGTVFLSSHLLAEVAHSADDAVVIDYGRLVKAGPVTELMPAGSQSYIVTTPDAERLMAELIRRGGTAVPTDGGLTVSGMDREAIARTALDVSALVVGLHSTGDDLESVFATLIHQEIS
jgi:ABC-2 type transport system ATP-binding protein